MYDEKQVKALGCYFSTTSCIVWIWCCCRFNFVVVT